MRASLFAAAVGALVGLSCSGLLTSQSNAYPCDFSQPPETRDAPCVTGDVCSVNNVCVRFVYEGPRFEGPATLPDFSTGAAAGTVVHPLQLTSAPESLVVGVPSGAAVVLSTQDAHTVVNSFGVSSFAASPGRVHAVQAAGEFGTVVALAMERPAGGIELQYADHVAPVQSTEPLRKRIEPGTMRFLKDTLGGPARLMVTRQLTGEVLATDNLNAQATMVNAIPLGIDAGIDFVANLTLPFGVSSRWPVLLVKPDGLYALADPRVNDSGVSELRISGAPQTIPFPPNVRMKLDATGTVLTLVGDNLGMTYLSTWRLSNDGANPVATRTWDDCSLPNVRWFNPLMNGATPTVEVIRSNGGSLVATQVIGSGGTRLFDACTTDDIEVPFSLQNLARTPSGDVVGDRSATPFVMLAGKQGQLWRGPSLAEVKPLYLDRVPLDVSVVEVMQGDEPLTLMTALTDSYLSAQEPAASTANGFRRVNVTSGSGGVSGLVHQSRDWVVTKSSDLLRLPERLFDLPDADGGTTSDAGRTVAWGPRLLNGRNQPVEQPLWGEALSTGDGGLSLLIAADDSLYFVPEVHSGANVSDEANQLPPEYPVLTPEPGVFIRHLAVERSALGSDGLTRVRGFVVTSRSAYQIELTGTPARWQARPLVLQAGEPAEVWYDNPRGGLGRIGYRDGTVYTLPGGYQLVAPLPSVTGARAPRVIDYENLGGWPVAFTTTGVYAAWWDTLSDGKLDNKFADGRQKPMQWRAVTLPDGGTPWLGSGDVTPSGRLFVKEEAYVCQATDGGLEECDRAKTQKLTRTFRLFLFQDHSVIELGRHTRNNKTPPQEF